MEFKNGWEFSFIGNYVRNGFDATGFINEGLAPNATSVGNYYYNNYGLFAGATKDFSATGPVSLGIRFLLGGYSVNYLAINGTSTYNGTTTDENLKAYHNTRFPVMDIGTRLGIRAFHSLTFFLNIDFISTFRILPSESSPYDAPINMFNFTLGIQYSIKTSH